MTGQDRAAPYCTEANRDGDFDGAGPTRRWSAEAWACWRGEVAFAERLVARTPDLGVPPRAGEGLSLR